MSYLIEELIGRVLLESADIPDLVAHNALVDTAREFCRDALAWRETYTLAVDPNALLVWLPLPTDASIRAVTACRWNDTVLTPTSEEQVHRAPSRPVTGTPEVYVQASGQELKLLPRPASGTLIVRAVLQPTLSAQELPDRLVDDWSEALINGAKARLLMVRDKPWSNARLAAPLYQAFLADKARAKSMAAEGHQVGVPRTVRYGGY